MENARGLEQLHINKVTVPVVKKPSERNTKCEQLGCFTGIVQWNVRLCVHFTCHTAAWWKSPWWFPADRTPREPAWWPPPDPTPYGWPWTHCHRNYTHKQMIHLDENTKVIIREGRRHKLLQVKHKWRSKRHIPDIWKEKCCSWKKQLTHPSPSFSRTSNTSSGCLVKLSSLSFFSLLQETRNKVIGNKWGNKLQRVPQKPSSIGWKVGSLCSQ